MKILIDIGHPGHVHLFRPFTNEMFKKGHEVFFTCREKEFEIELLKAFGFNFISFGKKFQSKTGKIFGLLKFDFQELFVALRFKPDIFISHGSPYAAHAAYLIGKPHISMEDTGNMEQIRLYLPFTKSVLVSSAFHKNLGKKQIVYNGYHELAYLSPAYFRNENVKDVFLKGNKFVLLRFISWNATHDIGQGGLTFEEKKELVRILEELGVRVFISSEGNLPSFFQKYKISIKPERMHNVLASADLFIGEGATMASECAVLGTPAIYINSMDAGTINEQEKYGLLFHFKNGNKVIEKVVELLNTPNLKQEWQKRRDRMLKDKIDVTAFLVWFVENYPESAKIMKENPGYQNRFK